MESITHFLTWIRMDKQMFELAFLYQWAYPLELFLTFVTDAAR